ncbi:Tlg2-vesicle protein [Entomophthora muscae]|uniref:Tlg2-vesicle protein n=1 Tax=Entomophthora muscae TaxID=34485 RepID=A0ACC2SXS6_9FUNG|nr:Tlg2-vesicle protein [Entomophthora muscae]
MAIRARDNFYSPVDILDDQPNYGSADYAPSPAKKFPVKITVSSLINYFQENRSRLAPLIIMAAVNAGILILVLIYHTPILSHLESLGLYLRKAGTIGMLVPIGLIFITSFPPMPGYGTLSVLCGFIYGFPFGIIPPFIGGVLGSSCCFFLSRRYGSVYVRRLLLHYTYIDAAMKAIEIKGVKLLFLIRLAPYPWTVMNFVLGATRISYLDYITATALSLVKILFHIYIGSSLSSFTEKNPFSTPKIVLGCVAFSTGLGVTIYLYFLCKKVISESLEEGYKKSDSDEEDLHPLRTSHEMSQIDLSFNYKP